MTERDSGKLSTDNEKKTGRVLPGAKSIDSFTVRQSLPTLEAVQKYDAYLRSHKRRLRQLERLAAGELTPSSENY